MDKIKKIHLVGVGGIGLSAMARYFLWQGSRVSGSDIETSFIIDDLQRQDARIAIGHHADNLDSDTDLLVYSYAIKETNPERAKARRLGIREISLSQCQAEIGAARKTIAISGNKGKTTTTAIAAEILEAAGLDPMAAVGSYVNSWRSNFRGGRSQYFVIEGDEYKEKMLDLSPWTIILTNLAPDHLDYYGTFENEIAAFQKYVLKLPADGLYIYNTDDPILEGLNKPSCKIIKFGKDEEADLRLLERRVESGRQIFNVSYQGDSLGEFSLAFPGEFNIYNALAGMALGLQLGIAPQKIKSALENFRGTWRRFQNVGQYNGATVISDYAHHPKAVEATIRGAKEFYPDKKVVAVFQPHLRHRTKSLFSDFVRCFDAADSLILTDIYQVKGRESEADSDISSKDLIEAIVKRDTDQGIKRQVNLIPAKTELHDSLRKEITDEDVVLMMGAGDIYKVAESIIKFS